MKANNKALAAAGVAVLFGGAVLAGKQMEQTRKRISRSLDRWHPITVKRDIVDVTLSSSELQPLIDLGDTVEILITPAPRGQGTEIAARLITGNLVGQTRVEALAKLRAALRNTQWLLETGEILSPDKPPSTHRTLKNLPLEFVTRFAREGGRL